MIITVFKTGLNLPSVESMNSRNNPNLPSTSIQSAFENLEQSSEQELAKFYGRKDQTIYFADLNLALTKIGEVEL